MSPHSPFAVIAHCILTSLRYLRSESGMAGVEIVITGCVAAAAISGTVITLGDEVSQQLEATVRDSVDRAGSAVYVRGSIVLESSGSPLAVDSVRVPLGIAGLTEPSAIDATRWVVTYHDSSVASFEVPFRLIQVGEPADGVWSPGETVVLEVDATALRQATSSHVFAPGQRWTLEVIPAVGAALSVSRTTPGYLDKVTALH